MRRLVPLVIVLFLILGTAAFVIGGPLETNPWVVAWFGPPAAEPREVHAENGTSQFDHSALDGILAASVRGHLVDYRAVGPQALDAYLETLADAPFDALSRDGKLALLMNAYNAFTLRLILDHGGAELGSIKDIPAADRWDAVRWRLAGRTVSLTQLEHEELRAKFVEPRLHFAINCASVGCPPLRSEAYTEDRLEQQLEDQAEQMHSDPAWLRIEGETVHLTPLYLWYAGDFEAVDGSVLTYAKRWAPALTPTHTIIWQDYDWSLNQAP